MDDSDISSIERSSVFFGIDFRILFEIIRSISKFTWAQNFVYKKKFDANSTFSEYYFHEFSCLMLQFWAFCNRNSISSKLSSIDGQSMTAQYFPNVTWNSIIVWAAWVKQVKHSNWTYLRYFYCYLLTKNSSSSCRTKNVCLVTRLWSRAINFTKSMTKTMERYPILGLCIWG